MVKHTIECNGCGQSFSFQPKDFHEDVIDVAAQVTKKYFVCPHCGEHYPYFYTDPTLDKMIHSKKPDTRKIKAYEDDLVRRYKRKDS
jgi:transcription elongation factor Elf1